MHEEQESLTQGQQEQIWEVETYSERHQGELWETRSEPSSFELEHINEDHKNLTQELVAPLKEHSQSENKVGLINLSQASPTNSYIEVKLIAYVGVDIFKWVVDPYLDRLVNKLKTKLIANGLVVEQKYSRRRKKIFQVFDHMVWSNIIFVKGSKLESFVHHYPTEWWCF